MITERDPSTLCKECGDHNRYIIARGMCKVCYDKWYRENKNNPTVTFQRMARRKKINKDNKPYPIHHIITVWECSDGREFSSEVEALRYEIDLFRN